MEVRATTGSSTDAPTNVIVSTQQSTASPNIAIATTGEYLNTLTEATLTTEHSADITTEVRASAKQFTNNLSDATVTTQQLTDIATKVIATAAQSTNTSSKTIVTTELLSTDTPTEEIVRSTDSPNETMLTTKQFMDIETEVIPTTKHSINTPKDTIVSTEPSITVTTGESINTPTKTLVPTEQSMAIPTEAIEHSTDTPKDVRVATHQLVFSPNVGMVTEAELMIAPTEAIETTDQSMDIAIKAVATAKQSPFTPTEATTTTGTIAKTDRSTDIAMEVMATSKQSMVTPNKAIVSTTQLIPVSNMATGLGVTVEVTASVNVTTRNSQGVNHNAPGMPLSTTAVVFENGEDDFAHEGFVNFGLGKTKVDTDVASPEKPAQVDDDGVGGTALQPSPSPTPDTLLEVGKDVQPEIMSTLPDDSANISLVEPPLSASEDTHQDDNATSGSVIVKEVSGTAKDPSEMTNDKNLLEGTKGKYSVSKEKETLTGAEVLLEAPTIELSIQKSTSVAEDVESSTSANLSTGHLAKESSEDLREEVVNDKLDTSIEAAPFVKKTSDAQSQMTVETAVHEVPPNPTVMDRPDSTDDVESPEVISDTNSKDITLALDPSVILLDVEDFMPEITPTTKDYTSGTHNMKIDSKKETIEENLLESKGRDRKISEVPEETTSTIPKIKGREGEDNDMSKDTEVPEDTLLNVPEIAPTAAVPGVTISGLPTNVVRSTGPLKEDDTPAPWVEVEKSTVGLNELTTNMQRNAISSTLQVSTQTSNNNIDKGIMVRSHCLRDYL